METSLRLGGDSKALRIHAKEKFPIDSRFRLQAHGEIDTYAGAPSYLALIIRNFYPELSASMGVGVQLNKRSKVGYTVRGKKAFPISHDGLVGINVKGLYDVDKDLRKMKQRGAVELAWSIFNFRKDQDVRIKLGYEVFDKMPYVQIRENNWTLNADLSGKWNIKNNLVLPTYSKEKEDVYAGERMIETKSNPRALKNRKGRSRGPRYGLQGRRMSLPLSLPTWDLSLKVGPSGCFSSSLSPLAHMRSLSSGVNLQGSAFYPNLRLCSRVRWGCGL